MKKTADIRAILLEGEYSRTREEVQDYSWSKMKTSRNLAGFRQCKIIAQRLLGTRKRQVFPRQELSWKRLDLERFISGRGIPSHDFADIDNDNHRMIGIGIDIQQPGDPNVDATFFTRLSDRRILHALAAIHKASRKNPLAVRGLDGPSNQENPTVERDDRPDRDFGIEKKHEAAGAADEPVRFAGLERPAAEGAPAFWAK